jgi:hypothetical protein
MTENKIQTEEEINRAWELLYKHLQSCEDWGNGQRVEKQEFIEIGKKEFIIIPIVKE